MSCSHQSAHTIKLPRADSAVHKDECVYCFDSWDEEAGIDVCLTCFIGTCRNHSRLHHNKSKHPISLNIKRTKKVQPKSDEPPQKITKVAIGVAGGANVDNEDQYTYTTKGFCHVCNTELPSSELLEKAATAILSATAASRQQDTAAWENQIIQCEHTIMLQQVENAPKLKSKGLSNCSACDIKTNFWLCMTCGNLACGRSQPGVEGNGHAVAHWNETKHPVVCKIGTITPEGTADIWCYACDESRLDPMFKDHMEHFGIEIAGLEKTEKSTVELDLDLNANLLLNTTIEEGKAAKNLYGSGYTGLKNLGNTCYMASVVQVMANVPEIKSRYLDTAEDHLNTCSNDPTTCFQCQMSKLFLGMFSGKYSQGPNQAQEDDAEFEQAGIPPRMLKSLICKGHPEFSTMRQQDAYEFFQFLLKTMKQRERVTGLDPTPAFEFTLQQRLECNRCHKVKYSEVEQSELSLPIPMDKAEPQVNPIAEEKERDRYVRENKSKVHLTSCLEAFTADEELEFFCPSCNVKTTATKNYRMGSFPSVLMMQMRRFVFEDWVPRKLGIQLDVPQHLDLEFLRGVGKADFEVELPEGGNSAPAEPQFNEAEVEMLTSMGFPRVRCEKALVAVGKAGLEAASDWLMQHMDDPDIDVPIPKKSGSGSGNSAQFSEESVSMLMEMGFSANQAKKALKECDGSAERALDWLFNHPDDMGEVESAATSEPAVPEKKKDNRPPNYQLMAFIVHLGNSVHSGHYVCFIRKEDKWIQFNDRKVTETSVDNSPVAYMYFYQKV